MTNTASNLPAYIRAGCGYFDITHYPIGGAFRRAGDENIPLAELTRMEREYKGCRYTGRTADGRDVALDSRSVLFVNNP